VLLEYAGLNLSQRAIYKTIFGRPIQVTVSSPYDCCLTITLVYCGQAVGWTKMPFGAEVGLGPGDIVLDGDPAPPTERDTTALPPFLAHGYFGPCLLWPNGRPSQQLLSACEKTAWPLKIQDVAVPVSFEDPKTARFELSDCAAPNLQTPAPCVRYRCGPRHRGPCQPLPFLGAPAPTSFLFHFPPFSDALPWASCKILL